MAEMEIGKIVAAIPIPAFFVGSNFRVQVPNDAALEIFGSDIEGRHYVTALRQPAILRAIDAAVAEQRKVVGQYTVSGPVSERKYRLTSALLKDRDQVGVLVCLEDVTPVYEAGQMRRDFVANVSHELRTPLTALLGFIDTLQGPARDDAKARDRFLATMSREAQRMNRLVGDLLSLSRVEFSERQMPDTVMGLGDILRASVATLTTDLDGARVTLRVEGCDPATDHVRGDADQLRQVFNNLIENALKYGGDAAPVVVSLSSVPQDLFLRVPSLRVDVRDQGPGIAEHHIPRLTERFYRVDAHRSRELGGTGLGLAIVKHIVQRHRGRLVITSEQGAGSCFSVFIPVA